jgi:recombination protein RecT
MDNKLSTKTAISQFEHQISLYEGKILKSLLEKHKIAPEQFVQIVISEVKKNSKLLDAFIQNPKSMIASILAGAEIGLTPSELTGEFYLIPRLMKQSDGSKKLTVTPLIGYKGLVTLLLRSGNITRIHTEVVYEEDFFEIKYGLEPDLKHIPNLDSKKRTAADIKAVYAVAKNSAGEYQFAVLTKDEIKSIANLNRYENDLYFNDVKNPNRWMEKKTALIQLSKLIDKDFHGKTAIERDKRIQGGSYLSLDDKDEVIVLEGSAVSDNKKKGSMYTFFEEIKKEDAVNEN